MIAKVLVTVLVLTVGDWDWINCEAWDSSKHCYLDALSATASAGTTPAIRNLGFYDKSNVGNHVCDQNKEVYKQVYLDQTVVIQTEAWRYQDVEADEQPFDGEIDCFQVANVPDSSLSSVCWNLLGTGVTAAGGVANNGAYSLDMCKQSCIDDDTCVGISYDDDAPLCSEYAAGADLSSTTASSSQYDNLYERLKCAELPSALMPGSSGHSVSSIPGASYK